MADQSIARATWAGTITHNCKRQVRRHWGRDERSRRAAVDSEETGESDSLSEDGSSSQRGSFADLGRAAPAVGRATEGEEAQHYQAWGLAGSAVRQKDRTAAGDETTRGTKAGL